MAKADMKSCMTGENETEETTKMKCVVNGRMRLSVKRRQIIAKIVPYLLNVGVVLPKQLRELAAHGVNRGRYRLSRAEVARIGLALAKHGLIVVTVKGLNKRLTCMSVKGYLNKVKSAQRVAALKSSKERKGINEQNKNVGN